MRFKGLLAATWRAHSQSYKDDILWSWSSLSDWALNTFLGAVWSTQQHLDFNNEVFRGSKDPHDKPAEYIQHRILHAQVFYCFVPHSAEETAAIMLNAPLEWNVMLHWSQSPPIELVLMLAKQYEDTLIATWKATCPFTRSCKQFQAKHVHHALADDDAQDKTTSLHSPYEIDPEDAFCYSSDEQNTVSKDAFSVQNHS